MVSRPKPLLWRIIMQSFILSARQRFLAGKITSRQYIALIVWAKS